MKLLNICASGSSISFMRSNRATNSTSQGKYKFPKSCILRRACHWNAKSNRTITTKYIFAFGFVFLKNTGQSQVEFFSEYDHPRSTIHQKKLFLPADFGVNLSLLAAHTASSLYPRSKSNPCWAATRLTTCRGKERKLHQGLLELFTKWHEPAYQHWCQTSESAARAQYQHGMRQCSPAVSNTSTANWTQEHSGDLVIWPLVRRRAW